MSTYTDWRWKDGKPQPLRSFHQWMVASNHTKESAEQYIEDMQRDDGSNGHPFTIEMIDGVWTFIEKEPRRANQETP